MRLALLLLFAVAPLGCAPGLAPRPALAEEPIGTVTTPPKPSGVSDDDDAKSPNGMVAAKIEDTDAKKPAKKSSPKRGATRKTSRGKR